MKIPDEYTIRTILEAYNSLCKEAKKQYDKNEIKINLYEDLTEEYLKISVQAIKLIFTKPEYSYADLMPFDYFINCVIEGYFTSYDGTGYYIDFNGNKLDYINWDNPEDYPEETVFIAWYNK